MKQTIAGSFARRAAALSFGIAGGAAPLLLGTPRCSAQTAAPDTVHQATAQALFDDARKLLAAGKIAEACAQFGASQRMDPGAGTLLNLGDCYERDGRIASAWATFREAGSEARRTGRPEWGVIADKRSEMLEGRVPALLLRLAPASTEGVSVQIDGKPFHAEPLPSRVPLDPGDHTVLVTAAGFVPFERRVTLEPGDLREIAVPPLTASHVEPPPPAAAPPPRAPAATEPTPASPPRRDWFPVGIGATAVGVLGLGLGSYLGIIALSKNSQAAESCPNPSQCPDQTGPTLTGQARTARTESIVAFSLGGALVLTGGILIGVSVRAGAHSRIAVTPVAALGPDGARIGAVASF